MYRYDAFDHRIVQERVAQFRDQMRRFLAGELTEDEFRPLRLQNGLYIQKYAPMLRIAIPYGLLSIGAAAHARAHRPQVRPQATATSRRARTSSSTGRSSRTCRTSSPNWRRSRCTRSRPSGNCIRNITSDHFAGVAARRSRRSAPVVRARAAVVDVPSGIRVPAAQVQDRDHRARRATAPRCWSTTSVCSSCATRCRRRRLSRPRRRRPGPHADRRARDPRIPAARRDPQLPRRDPARLQPLSAAATTSTRRGSRSWSRSGRPKCSRRTSKRNGRICAAARRPCPTTRSSA